MDYSYILNSALPQKEKLLEYGFSKDDKAGGGLVCKKDIQNGRFYVLLRLTLGEKGLAVKDQLTAEVWEKATGEKYALFDVVSAQGTFVGQIRNEVQTVIDEICDKCFLYQDLHQKYIDFLAKRFSVTGDNPWASEDGSSPDDEDYAVFRCPNQKWFALVMKIRFRQLGFISGAAAEENVWVVNLKADPSIITNIIDKKSIFPAYHMNKKYWITILLTAVTDLEQLCDLTCQSFDLVANKK